MLEKISNNRVFIGNHSLSWERLISHALDQKKDFAEIRTPLAFIIDSSHQAINVLAQILVNKSDAILIGRDRVSQPVQDLLLNSGFSIVDEQNPILEPTNNTNVESGRISLLTSGTTGSPKLVHHSWKSINTYSNTGRISTNNWVLPYQIGTYAWFQLVSLSLFVEGQNLIISDEDDMHDNFKIAKKWGASAISATPTFWRVAAMQVSREDLSSIDFKQITLGGEIVDQSIIDLLSSLYPNCKITHIYASSEAGASIIVSDGEAGFPEDLLYKQSNSPIKLRINDGRLFVKSTFSAKNSRNDDEWVDTGDRVEKKGDRIYFKGRVESSMINVGGNKAFPVDIEEAILLHPEIEWCRVRPVKAPLLGFLPEVDVYTSSGTDKVNLEKMMIDFLDDKIPEYAVPRIWNFLDEIPISANLKSEL